MITNPLEPLVIAAARADGYRQAANNVAEMLSAHGSEFTAGMALVVLEGGAAVREAFVASLEGEDPNGDHRRYATLRQEVAEWIWEANTSGGLDATDLMFRLSQAGVGLQAELDAIDARES